MNGAEHYAEAERLLSPDVVAEYPTAEGVAALIATAQVHATLAVAYALRADQQRHAHDRFCTPGRSR